MVDGHGSQRSSAARRREIGSLDCADLKSKVCASPAVGRRRKNSGRESEPNEALQATVKSGPRLSAQVVRLDAWRGGVGGESRLPEF